MNIKNTLNNELLAQDFADDEYSNLYLARYKQMASTYAEIENSIAVLSDIGSSQSYIYYGGVGEVLGLALQGDSLVIDSIWEENIFCRIHPDDLLKKHTHELQFLHFLKNISAKERANYYLAEWLRMCDKNGVYYSVLYRMFYVVSPSSGNIRLALCLYNLTGEFSAENMIVNSVNGCRTDIDTHDCSDLLSVREKEVLTLIGKGKSSKEIACELSLSVHTINRHRQNILQKLHVNNSAQAFSIAHELHLL